MKRIMYLILLLMSSLLISCTPAEKMCVEDADCVPADCCHSVDAVNKENAPDCSSVLCSAVCEPGTLDCGQGEAKCVSGRCKAVIR